MDLRTTLDELLRLSTETEWIELKQNYANPDDIGQYVSALSNAAALHKKPRAWLIWGIDDETHRPVGTTADLKRQKGKGNEDLEPWLLRHLAPRIDFVIHPPLDVDGARIVMLEIPAAKGRPTDFQQQTWIRVGSHKKPLREFQEKEKKLWQLLQADNVDATAKAVEGATTADFDPGERVRLRSFIETNNGDRALLALDDDELDGALGFTVRTDGGSRVPSLTGLLMIGREGALRDLVHAHEVALQRLDGEDVRLNEFKRAPLVRVIEWLETSFNALNVEEEVQAGLFRVPVPLVDKRAFREAIANALCHRDYRSLGAVHVRFETDALVISNPGGFVDGVTIDNLLTTEPRPRNPALADAAKRIGLVERTGRGVDLIYRGLLRYGRPRPSYERSDDHSVVLRIPTSRADVAFLKLVLDEERTMGGALPIDSLIALSLLKDQRRASKADVAAAMQKDEASAARTLEVLVERGLVEPHGVGRARSYTLSAKLYAAEGKPAAFTLQKGLSRDQQELLVMNMARQHKSIRRRDVEELCRINEDAAQRLLSRMVKSGRLVAVGANRGRTYEPGAT